ncbi:MAG: nitroreductase family protein [Cellvibrionaceae bacterium]|nr:nitroreductase family protein [Cellvibrionaceae bacterium]
MNVSAAIKQRKSVRAFKPDSVPDTLIKDILLRAQQAPSNCNTQPWYVTVFSGAARQQLERALVVEVSSGKQAVPAFAPGNEDLSGVYTQNS